MKYFLIGFMGSGKSYIGKKICEKINLSHIDLDDYIAKHEHKSISNIFFEDGEMYFREIEKQYLSKIINKDNFLLSTGGGTPIYNNNLDLMNIHGLTIYLRYSHNTLYNRLKNNWALQADPTLKYAAYKSKDYNGVTIKRVLNIHKKIESPYNTYLYKGLPPGLIAMPDLSTIDAVLNYEKHSYFYFAANSEKPGFHNFARSLKDHNINAINYQNYLNKKGIKK